MFKTLLGALSLFIGSAQVFAEPIVIAHRGASGYLPEHTLEAKSLAYGMGADYIEQDLVLSKDNQLIVFHDLVLDHMTDVAQHFPSKRRDDGHFYVIDFTLAELKSLRVTERTKVNTSNKNKREAAYPSRFPISTSSFAIHTFAEELELIQGLNKVMNKQVGIYPEVKSPWFHQQHNKDISRAVLTTLKQFGYTKKTSPVFLQSFDANELKRIHDDLLPELAMDIKLVQLIAETSWNETYERRNGQWQPYSYDWMFSPEGMQNIAQYADGVGPWKSMLISDQSTKDKLIISDLVRQAHKAGMQVHPYTFRADPERIPGYAESFEDMVTIFVEQLNIDGLFTDFPDKALRAIK